MLENLNVPAPEELTKPAIGVTVIKSLPEQATVCVTPWPNSTPDP